MEISNVSYHLSNWGIHVLVIGALLCIVCFIYILYVNYNRYRPIAEQCPSSRDEPHISQTQYHDVSVRENRETPRNNLKLRHSGSYSVQRSVTPTRNIKADRPSTTGQSGVTLATNNETYDIRSQPDVETIPIGEADQTKIIVKIQELRNDTEFCLRITTVTIDANCVTIYYLRKCSGENEYHQTPSESGYSSPNAATSENKKVEMKYVRFSNDCNFDDSNSPPSDKVKDLIFPQNESNENETMNSDDFLRRQYKDGSDRDTSSLTQAVRDIVPDAIVDLIEIKELPCFQPTVGLSSSLMHTDNLNVNGPVTVGCITALLIGDRTSKDFAITVGHTVSIGEKICIVQSDNSTREIGTVIEKICENQEGLGFIDAAVIELYESSIEDLNLKQQFLIDDVSYRLSAFQVDSPEKNRIILRAIDNDNIKGIVSSACLNIFEGPRTPMYRCTQVMRYNEDGNHGGAIHSEGQSGLLGTYEPTPDEGEIVKPVVILIGLYPVYNRTGERVSDSSVGVNFGRVLDCLARSARVNQDLKVNTINI